MFIHQEQGRSYQLQLNFILLFPFMSLHFFLDFPWLVWICCILECSASITCIGLKFGLKAQTN